MARNWITIDAADSTGADGDYASRVPALVRVRVIDSAGAQVRKVTATGSWTASWPVLPPGEYRAVAALLRASDYTHLCKAAVRDFAVAEPPSPSKVVTREADLVEGLRPDFDSTNYSVVVDPSIVTPSGMPAARARVGTQWAASSHIARANWFAPLGSGVEREPVVAEGAEVWTSGWYRWRVQDPNSWTQFLRLSDNDSTAWGGSAGSPPYCVMACRLSNSQLFCDLSDYGGGGPTGVPNRVGFIAGPIVSKDEWHYVEHGGLVSADPGRGWWELWVDGERVGRSEGRTIKLADAEYRRVQHGFGDCYNPSDVTQEVHFGDCYLGPVRRGPS